MDSAALEREGLLDGLEGEAREARLTLLLELADDGASLEELREAIAADRLVLLPAERALRGTGERLTRAEVAERTGLRVELLERLWRSLGMPEPAPDESAFTGADVAALERVSKLIEAGVPERGVLEVNRVLGVTMSQLAAALRGSVRDALLAESDSELELGTRYAAAVRELVPLFVPALEYALRLQLHEQLATEAVERAQLADGLPGASTVAVGFADLVDFTELGERLEVAAVGDLADRLADLVADVSVRGVRLVKLIGDAAMLSAPDPDDLAVTALELVAAAEQEQDFPRLRAGIALGEVLSRGGDLYGGPVNLASRLTSIARPGSVLCSERLHDELCDRDAFRFSFARQRQLKGIREPQKLFRLRFAAEADDGGEGADRRIGG